MKGIVEESSWLHPWSTELKFAQKHSKTYSGSLRYHHFFPTQTKQKINWSLHCVGVKRIISGLMPCTLKANYIARPAVHTVALEGCLAFESSHDQRKLILNAPDCFWLIINTVNNYDNYERARASRSRKHDRQTFSREKKKKQALRGHVSLAR